VARRGRTGAFTLLLALAAGAGGAAEVAVAARAASLGLGAELAVGLSEHFNVRVAGHAFDLGYSGVEDDVAYEFDLRLLSGAALLDLHPGAGGFRVTAGVVWNGNELAGLGRLEGDKKIGGGTYTPAEVSSLSLAVDFEPLAGYAGIGFGNAVRGGRIGFLLDLGVAFQGAPKIRLAATGPITALPSFQRDLHDEERNLNDDFREYQYFPVLSVGLALRF
jgi:hypothetical protein